MLLLQVMAGAVLGLLFLVAFVRFGTWMGRQRPVDPAVDAFRAHQHLRHIRRQTIRQLLETSRRMERSAPSTSQGWEIIEAEDEQP